MWVSFALASEEEEDSLSPKRFSHIEMKGILTGNSQLNSNLLLHQEG